MPISIVRLTVSVSAVINKVKSHKRTRLPWSNGKDEHNADTEAYASQWNQVVVVLGRHNDVDNDEDNQEREQHSEHNPTTTTIHSTSVHVPW